MAKVAGRLGAVYIPTSSTNISDETVELDALGSGTLSHSDVWVNHIYEDDGGVKGAEIPESKWMFSPTGDIVVEGYANETVHVDYDYYTLEMAAGFTGWTLTDGVDTLEATDFGSQGFREFVVGLREWSAEAGRYWMTEDTYDHLGERQLVRFYIDVSGYYFEGWCICKGIDLSVPVDELVKQSISFQGLKQLVYVTP